MKTIRIIIIFFVALFVLMQFFGINKNNRESDPQNDFIFQEAPLPNIAIMIKNTCYDCHSNQTIWPWYSNIAPISWMVEKHVVEGRETLNFSNWNDYNQEDRDYIIKEMIEEIKENTMPLPSYNTTHQKANLTVAQKIDLIKWLKIIQ
ncbi:MAG: cytochrome C [Bacteroidetes bacterium 4572_77]|nr:MAG: cytochrome C [Bacteroidetes bacterium 4572_77]